MKIHSDKVVLYIIGRSTHGVEAGSAILQANFEEHVSFNNVVQLAADNYQRVFLLLMVFAAET